MNSTVKKTIIFIIAFYVCLNFHADFNRHNTKFDTIYHEFKTGDQQHATSEFIEIGEKSSAYLIEKIEKKKNVKVKIDILRIIAATGCNNCENKL